MYPLRHLILVLGDQLDLEAAAFDGFDPTQDVVWMAEADEESTHVVSSKPRIALFLSAMRHFAQALREGDRACPYTTLYWAFLMRHEPVLAQNARMALQLKNAARMSPAQQQAVQQRADAIRRGEVGALNGLFA